MLKPGKNLEQEFSYEREFVENLTKKIKTYLENEIELQYGNKTSKCFKKDIIMAIESYLNEHKNKKTFDNKQFFAFFIALINEIFYSYFSKIDDADIILILNKKQSLLLSSISKLIDNDLIDTTAKVKCKYSCIVCSNLDKTNEKPKTYKFKIKNLEGFHALDNLGKFKNHLLNIHLVGTVSNGYVYISKKEIIDNMKFMHINAREYDEIQKKITDIKISVTNCELIYIIPSK